MRSIFIFLGLAFWFQSAGFAQSNAPVSASPTDKPLEEVFDAPVLKLSSDQVVQGQLCALELEAPWREGVQYTLEGLGQKIPFYDQGPIPNKSHHRFRTFLSVKADLKPGGYTLSVKDEEGHRALKEHLEVKPGSFYSQYIRFVSPPLKPEQQKQVAEEDKWVDAVKDLRTEQAFWNGPFVLPVPHRVSAAFGTRRYLNGKYNGYHSGVDFASPMGYPVKAPGGARVALARYFSKYNSNGNLVFLDHGQGITSVYIHFSKLAVKEGDRVSKGQTIGYIGSTGRSTGPHLHWGFYLNGQNVDGLAWIRFSERAFQ